jgi:hypothetical protein
LIACEDDVALLNGLPVPNECSDLVPQLKNALLVMHQCGLLEYEVLHWGRQSVPLDYHCFAEPTNNVLIAGWAIEDTRPNFHRPNTTSTPVNWP